jgi:hypothetical protein
MIIQYYKPNSNNTGCAFGFQLGVANKSKEPSLFMTAIQQFSWNEKTKNGSFSENFKNPEKSISLKFNENEIGGFIYAIEQYSEFSAFHTYEENKTAISFKPYTKKNGQKAFSFSVTRNSANKFGIGLEMSEAYSLAQFFKFTLNQIYSFRIASNEK